MPTGRQRSGSRGRPPKKREARSSSASRPLGRPQSQKKPAESKKASPIRLSKSPQKVTPKETARRLRSRSQTRKANTAPAAVASKKQKSKPSSRPGSPRSQTEKTKASQSSQARGAPRSFTTISTTTFSAHASAIRGSASPPALRSRTLAAALSQRRNDASRSPSTKTLAYPQRVSFWQRVKSSNFARQLGKGGRSVKKNARLILRGAQNNWRTLLLTFSLLLIAGVVYKFNRELLQNVRQINKQVLEFIQQHYEQQRGIFGEMRTKIGESFEYLRQNYLLLPSEKEAEMFTKTTTTKYSSPSAKIKTATKIDASPPQLVDEEEEGNNWEENLVD